MRKKIIIGNWKMNLSLNEARNLTFKLKSSLRPDININLAVCPPFVHLLTVTNILKDSNIQIGAQNMFYKVNGAFTGEISGAMLNDLHINLVIIGHSERRQIFHESDEDINLKIKAALEHDLIPVFCVGENLKTREDGKAEEWVKNQVLKGIKELSNSEIQKLIIAYEPIWAIGSGKICTGEDANKIIKTIRKTIKEKAQEEVSQNIRILYGGSIKSDNFTEHINYPDIDGGLVGGASIVFDEFFKIVCLANNAHAQLQSHPV